MAVCCRYLLRRLKRDVNVNLPTKTEQVLFCRLAPPQRETYKDFLRSREVRDVLSGDMQPFRAVGILRKICNHPDLTLMRASEEAALRSNAAHFSLALRPLSPLAAQAHASRPVHNATILTRKTRE